MKRKLAILATTICISFALKAQDISGHFNLQVKQMIDGTEYLNAIATEITVTKTKDSIIIIRNIPATNNEKITSTETLPLNGKHITSITSSNRKKVSSITLDKANNIATIITTLSYIDKPEEIEFKNTETWSLENNGTLTIIKKSDATITDDWAIKAIFKKY